MTHIPSYLQALIFSVLFLLFLNGDIGSVLLYVIAGANILSAVLLFISQKKFTIALQNAVGIRRNGENVEFCVQLQKKGFCFIPFVEICVAAENPIRLRTSLLFRKTVTVNGWFKASHSGVNRVRVEKILLGDLLGNFRRTVIVQNGEECSNEIFVAVLPNIVEYDGPEVLPNMLPSEEEEVEEGASVLQGGMPGYEHREYAPGDSPRRVNYKLSAKKGRLMVRMDESNGNATTNLYISDNALPICCDKAFALASRLIMRGGTVKITHKSESRVASTPETLDRMREWLAFREFAETLDMSYEKMPADTAVMFSGDGVVTEV